MELELDPARLPEGFPFATVLELEEFFSFVEIAGGAGGRDLPAETRATLQRWFPDLWRFLDHHTGGGHNRNGRRGAGERGEVGGGEEEGGEEEDEVER